MKKQLLGMGLCFGLATTLCLAENNPFSGNEVKVTTEATKEATASTTAVVSKESKADSETPKVEEKKENQAVEYTVVLGDYLMKIARRFYGDSSRWPELVEANKDKYPSLLSNPNLIYEDWTLTIPNPKFPKGDGEGNEVASTSTTPSSSSSTSSTPSSTTSISGDPSNNAGAGYAPKYSTGGSGQPALHYQKAPSGSGVNTKSPQFKQWFSEAIATYGDWAMPTIKNKYGQVISVEMFMKAIFFIESNGTHRKSDGSLVKSHCGAQGFLQIMPATAKELGVDATDPKQNIAGSVKLFKQIFTSTYVGKKSGTDKMILAACGYNAGPWSKCVQGTWQDCKNMGSGEVANYGLKFKMCVGLELTSDEIAMVQKMAGGKSVQAYADECYSYAQGLGL